MAFGLRIQIDQEDALAGFGQASRQTDGGRRLADAAFLVDERVTRASPKHLIGSW